MSPARSRTRAPSSTPKPPKPPVVSQGARTTHHRSAADEDLHMVHGETIDAASLHFFFSRIAFASAGPTSCSSSTSCAGVSEARSISARYGQT